MAKQILAFANNKQQKPVFCNQQNIQKLSFSDLSLTFGQMYFNIIDVAVFTISSRLSFMKCLWTGVNKKHNKHT